MQCYQIDFVDGSRILVDANDEKEARRLAIEKSPGGMIENVDVLDD